MDLNERPFASEAELRDHLAKNLDVLEPGLRLFQRHKNVIEFSCSKAGARDYKGRIDILAYDRKACFVVIECKHGTAGADSLGQLLGYISWFRIWSRPFVRPVRGYIVAHDATPFLILAVHLVAFVEIRVYAHPSPSVLKRLI